MNREKAENYGLFSKSKKRRLALILAAVTAAAVLSRFVPLSGLAAKLSFNADGLSYSADSTELAEENERLAAENAELRNQLAHCLDAVEENKRLLEYYEIKKENPSYKIVPASVVRREASDDFYSFTLDVGSLSGIRVNSPVITENGLVGRVSRVDSSSCKVSTVLSPETKVSAVDRQSGDCGIVSGSGSLCDKNLTLLNNIPSQNSVKPGDIIVTSGIGGVYPKNLIIGKVEKVTVNGYDNSVSAEIEPYQNFSQITAAAVIIDM